MSVVLLPLEVFPEPPLTDEVLPDARLEYPPPTQAENGPLAVLVLPPLTESATPWATLFMPPPIALATGDVRL